MKSIIGEKRTEVVNSWRRRYFGVSIADNGCRTGKIPTPGEKGLSELLFCASYTGPLPAVAPRGSHVLTPKANPNERHPLAHGCTSHAFMFTRTLTGLRFQQRRVHLFCSQKELLYITPHAENTPYTSQGKTAGYKCD